MTCCPHCGCNLCHLEEVGQTARRPWARYRCDACERLFFDGAEPRVNRQAVVVKAPRCPKCNSAKTRANGSRKSRSHSQYQRQNRVCLVCRTPFLVLKERTGDDPLPTPAEPAE